MHIDILHELDGGYFSIVHLGELRKPDGSVQRVAVKEGKHEKEDDMLHNEAKILSQLDHKNIIKLVAFQSNPSKLILEYMEWGNLEKAVQYHEFNDTDILKALHDVATGLEYITEMKYIHRDLACKNVFVDSDKTCKIGDFGLSRYFGDTSCVLVKEEPGLISIHTAPPESHETKIYSLKSEAWAFGVLIWELYSLREEYPHSYNEYVSALEDLRKTGLLSCPPTCPRSFFDYVKVNLLSLDPQKRPDLTSVKETIGEMLCYEELCVIVQ